MAVTFTQAQYNIVQQVVQRYVNGNAPENQFHDTEINQLATVAKAVGFIPRDFKTASVGAFQEAAKNRPLTTLMDFLAFVGHP